jgi:hypothetical protein
MSHVVRIGCEIETCPIIGVPRIQDSKARGPSSLAIGSDALRHPNSGQKERDVAAHTELSRTHRALAQYYGDRVSKRKMLSRHLALMFGCPTV